jgi:hypothetical protein
LPSNEQRAPAQGQGYKLLRQGIAAYRDPGGFYVYLVAAGFPVTSLPYLTAGVSSSPGPVVGGCNLGPGRRVVRSTPGGTLSLEGPKNSPSAPTHCAAGGKGSKRSSSPGHSSPFGTRVQGTRITNPYGRVCSRLCPGGFCFRSSAGGKGRSFCSSRLKTSGPFSLVSRGARTGPP